MLFMAYHFSLEADFRTMMWGRVYQTAGLAFLFIPINTAAYSYLPREKNNAASGLINLSRNIGASVGIATVTTMLQRRTQVHQSQLMEHVNGFSAAYHNMLTGTQTRLVSAGSGLAQAGAQAHGMVYNVVQRQAVMLAFIDNFKMLGVVFLAVIPVLLLLKKPKSPGASVPVH